MQVLTATASWSIFIHLCIRYIMVCFKGNRYLHKFTTVNLKFKKIPQEIHSDPLTLRNLIVHQTLGALSYTTATNVQTRQAGGHNSCLF